MSDEQIKHIVQEFRAEAGKIRNFWGSGTTTTNTEAYVSDMRAALTFERMAMIIEEA